MSPNTKNLVFSLFYIYIINNLNHYLIKYTVRVSLSGCLYKPDNRVFSMNIVFSCKSLNITVYSFGDIC